jgi:nicotinamidase-related amidase
MTTALLVIDVQTSLVAEGAWEFSAVAGRINELLQRARRAGAPVVMISDSRIQPDGSTATVIVQDPGDIRINKDFCDAFVDTCLLRELQARRVDGIVISGMQTEFCVDTTCRRAVSLGFNVVLAADAHTTNDGGALSAEQIVAHHNAILQDLGAGSAVIRVMRTEDVQW